MVTSCLLVLIPLGLVESLRESLCVLGGPQGKEILLTSGLVLLSAWGLVIFTPRDLEQRFWIN